MTANYDLSNSLLEDYTVFTLDEEENLFATHGLCILVKKNISNYFHVIKEKSRHVLWLNVSRELIGFEFVLGSLYLPCESSTAYDASAYEAIHNDVLSFDIPIYLSGDFISRTGQLNDILRLDDHAAQIYALDEIQIDKPEQYIIKNGGLIDRVNSDSFVNNPGKSLVELCQIQNLCILNGRFFNDISGNFTYYNRNHGKSTIDYVVVSPVFCNHLLKFEVCDFDGLLSDTHCALSVSLKNSLDRWDSAQNENLIDVSMENYVNSNPEFSFKWSNDTNLLYHNSFSDEDFDVLSQCLEDLNGSPSQENMDSFYEKLSSILVQKSVDCGASKIKVKTKNNGNSKKQPWFDAQCQNSRDNYYRVKNKLKFKDCDERLNKIRQASKRFKLIILKKKAEYFKKFNNKLRVLKSNNSKDYWNFLNKANSSKKEGCDIMIETLKEHFQKISNKPENATDDEFDINIGNSTINEEINGDFTFEEIKAIIKKLKCGKACGLDQVRNEFIKNCPDNVISIVVKLFNIVLKTGIIPDEWCIGVIIPLYKNKGSPKDPDNFRGITLLSCIGKLFTSVLNYRLTKFLDENGEIGDEQAGFRAGYSTTDHIFTLYAIINIYISSGKQLYCAFVDYRKAFDFVDRVSLWSKMIGLGINGNLLRIIYNLYEKAKSCVKNKGYLSDYFQCNVGVRQGENLSPLLFAIFLNDFEYSISRKYNGLSFLSAETYQYLSDEDVVYFIRVFTLLYADDTIVLAETAEQLQLALNAVYDYCQT